MNDLLQQIRLAVRTSRKSPTFSAVVVLTLALGIGANTAIFSLMDQLLVRSLPVNEPERLVVIDAPGPFSGSTEDNSDVFTPISHPMFEGLRDRNDVFESVLAHFTTSLHLLADGETREVRGDLVSGTFFSTLGVEPAVGRLIGEEDDRVPAGHPVVVLGNGYWRRRFAASPDVVGRELTINGHPMTIIGVAPAGFHGVEVGFPIDVYVPLMMHGQMLPTWRSGLGDFRSRWLTPMARLSEGVSIEHARAGINVLYRQLLQEDLATVQTQNEDFRQRFANKSLELSPGGRGTSELRFQTKTPLLVLMGMVGFVLLIVCANVANLQLARALGRRKEIALRVAMGASRARLIRELLVEGSLLAIAGGLLGLLFASWTTDLLITALPFQGVSQAVMSEPDARVFFFAFGLSLFTGLLFSIVPALSATSHGVAPTLKNEAGTSTRHALGFRRGLVVVQVALSLLLLAGAGLLVRSLMNLRAIDPGFEPERLITFTVNPARNGYAQEKRLELVRELRNALSAEPGVSSVSLAEVPLIDASTWSTTVRVEGYESADGENMNPANNGVAPEFFSTIGLPILTGRDFRESDDAAAPKIAIVNETFARYYFQDESPLGRRIGFGRGDTFDVTIVGTVRNGKTATMREDPVRFIYLPYKQSAELGSVTFYVRSRMTSDALAPRFREITARVDPTLPVTDLKSMTTQIGDSLFVERLVAALSVAFGVLSALLAALGLYGVMSYSVSSRIREIGIRVALGAKRERILLLVLEEVALLVAAGIAVGIPSGYVFGRLLESQLYGIGSTDAVAFAAAVTLLGVASILAGYVPAARASRVDPMVVLRYE